MQEFPQQLPHGEITEIFPDVFFVIGQSKFEFQDNTLQFSRSMTIIRDGDRLTLANSMRLDDDQGLASLDRLGKVENIVRVAANHGRDDAFYSDRYAAPGLGAGRRAAGSSGEIGGYLDCRQRGANQGRNGCGG